MASLALPAGPGEVLEGVSLSGSLFLKVVYCFALCIPKDAQIVGSELTQSEHTLVGDGAFVLLALETPELLTC